MKRILLIDDQADIRQVVQLSLEIVAGWQVISCNTGLEGVELAQKEKWDVILLDLMMPNLDGVATLHLLESCDKTQQIPVILLTADIPPAKMLALKSLGFSGIITKPFEPISLASQIALTLQWDLTSSNV
ncbi:MAG: response regulator [Microcoleaceae cyanobacterium]